MTSPGILLLHRADGRPVATAFRAASLGERDPFAAGRQIAWAGPDAMAAGCVSFEGPCESAAFPHTELIVVVAGRLRLTGAGRDAVALAPGQSAVIARRTPLGAEAAPGTRWVFCATNGATSAAPGLHDIQAAAALSPSPAPPAEWLIGPTPRCRSFNAFTDQTARLRAGIWDSTPYRRVSRPHRVNELMHLVSGCVDLTDADGAVTRLAQGDSAFVVHGAACAWDSREPVAKFYAVQEVAA